MSEIKKNKLTPEEKQEILQRINLLTQQQKAIEELINSIKKEKWIIRKTKERIVNVFQDIENPLPDIIDWIKDNISMPKFKSLKWKDKEETKKNVEKAINEDPEFKDIWRIFRKKYWGKISRYILIAVIVLLASGVWYFWWHGLQEYRKGQKIKKFKEEQKEIQRQDSIAENERKQKPDTVKKIDPLPPDPTKITMNELKYYVPIDKLDNLDTAYYQQLMDVLNAMDSSDVKIRLIDFLKKWNIIWAQEYFGMFTNSEYKSNKATGIIDANTLLRFSDPMFRLSGDDILNHPNIPLDVKSKYKELIENWQRNKKNVPWSIISKTDCRSYLFNVSNQLINVQDVCLWLQKWEAKFLIFVTMTTQAGRYIIQNNTRRADKGGEEIYIPTFRTRDGKIQIDETDDGTNRSPLLDLVPIDIQTWQIDPSRYDSRCNIAVHSMVENNIKYPVFDYRKEVFESRDVTKRRCTWGCVCLSDYAIVHDNTGIGALVFVTGEPK